MTELNVNLTSASASERHTFSGWTAGGGVELGLLGASSFLGGRVTAKAEYLYADLGKHNFFDTTASGCCTSQSTRLTQHMVRFALNYYFDWAQPAISSRY